MLDGVIVVPADVVLCCVCSCVCSLGLCCMLVDACLYLDCF